MPPDKIPHNFVVKVCGDGGQWQLAVEFLREMEKTGIAPDEIPHNSAVKARGEGGQWQMVMKLLREMTMEGDCTKRDNLQRRH